MQRLARHLHNTTIQTIRLDSRNKDKQLSDRQCNQLMTYGYMIGVANDKLASFGEEALVGGVDEVLKVAKEAIWDQEGPGSSHSAKAMVPFLQLHGVNSAADFPRTVAGFAELGLHYAHEMQQMLFDEVMEMMASMRAELAGSVHGVETMDMAALQMAYRAHQLNLAPASAVAAMAVPIPAPHDVPMAEAVLYVAPEPVAPPPAVEVPTETLNPPLDSDDEDDDVLLLAIAKSPAEPSPASTQILTPSNPRENYFQTLLHVAACASGHKRPRSAIVPVYDLTK